MAGPSRQARATNPWTIESSPAATTKKKSGSATAALIENGQTVIIGGGSTTVEVARHLLDRPLQIITNSMTVAQVFWDSRQVEVTLTGGYMYPRLGIQLGPICERMLNGVAADVLVMGVRGITESGLSDGNSLVVVADLTDLDVIVSDTGVSSEFQQMVENSGVQCILA